MKRGSGVGLVVLLLWPVPGVGQGTDSLDRVRALMDQGRIEAAREALLAWWDRDLPRASRVDEQRALWLRGQLTVDPAMAELDFRRLVLEYPGGPFTDQALYRLALWAEARGDASEATDLLRRLVRDYPASDLRPRVEEMLRDGLGPALPLARPPTQGAPSVGGRALEEGRRPFAVQLGAFRSSESARDLARRLRGEGYEPRVVRVPGSDLVRVRVGRFPTRGEAEEAMLELRRRGFDATLSTDALVEEEVGGGGSGTLPAPPPGKGPSRP